MLRFIAKVLCSSRQSYDEAEQEFLKSIQLAPNIGRLHLAFADFLVNGCKRPDEAEREYRKAIECDPKLVDARVALGNLLITYNNAFDEADGQFKKALSLNPRCAQAHVGLAKIDANLYHNYAGAEEELKKALVIDKQLLSAALNLGILYYQNMNRVSEAKTQLEAAIKYDPDCAEAHYFLALVLAQDGKATESTEVLAELNKALALDPQNALYETKIGWFLAHSSKRYKEAEAHYRKAIEVNNNLSEAHYLLALLLIEKLGMRKSGDIELRKAYEQEPTNPQIKAAFLRYVGK